MLLVLYIISALCSLLPRFGILREEYGREEQLYVIRKNLGISQGQFGQLEEEEQEDMLEQELWVKEKFVIWKEEKEAEKRIKMAQSGRWVSGSPSYGC